MNKVTCIAMELMPEVVNVLCEIYEDGNIVRSVDLIDGDLIIKNFRYNKAGRTIGFMEQGIDRNGKTFYHEELRLG
jgi:hypothetical protein